MAIEYEYHFCYVLNLFEYVLYIIHCYYYHRQKRCILIDKKYKYLY